jgi:hypothetical protein
MAQKCRFLAECAARSCLAIIHRLSRRKDIHSHQVPGTSLLAAPNAAAAAAAACSLLLEETRSIVGPFLVGFVFVVSSHLIREANAGNRAVSDRDCGAGKTVLFF